MRRRPGQALKKEGVAKEVKSNAQEMLGKAKEAIDCAIDSAKLEAKRLARQAKREVQKGPGELKRRIRAAPRNLGRSSSDSLALTKRSEALLRRASFCE